MDLLNYFYINGKKVYVKLTTDGIYFDCDGILESGRNLPTSQIVSCWCCPKGKPGCCCPPSPPADAPEIVGGQCPHSLSEKWKGLALEVCERCLPFGGKKWANKIVVLRHLSQPILNAWKSEIWARIQKLEERPRNLLVIVNPVGGRRKGPVIYERKVKPLLARAAIKTTMLQTRYKGHGIPLLQKALQEDIFPQGYDGIVAVGGDGLVSELSTALFLEAVPTTTATTTSVESDMPVTKIRLGIVPCGSTDAICFATHGTNDVLTALLHIVMGDRRSIDVAALRKDANLLRVVSSFVSYGYFGDLIRSSERLRWMGGPRYFFSGLRQVICHRAHPVTVKVKVKVNKESSSPRDPTLSKSDTCSSICSTCNLLSEDGGVDDEDQDGWREMTGDFSIVSAAVVSCACKMSPLGVSPTAHLGDGHTDLILVSGRSRKKLLSYLYHTRYTGNASRLNHVEMIRTREIELSASPATSSYNVDGEHLEASSISIKIYRQKLQLFCRGIEDNSVISDF